MQEATNSISLITPAAVLAQPLALLESTADAFAAAYADATGRDNFRLKRCAQEYADAFQLAIVAHPDREVILAYAQDATRYAKHVKHCTAATVSHMSSSMRPMTRALFAAWRASEQAFVDAGYRAVSFHLLYDSITWPGVSRKIEFLIFRDFFVQREEGEEPVRHAENVLLREADLVNPDHPDSGEEVVAWAGSRWVVGRYQGQLAGANNVRSGDKDFLTSHMMSYDVAVKSGVWPFKDGMKVAAWLDSKWQEANWITYHGDAHLVCLDDGVVQVSERAHTIDNAIAMGLLASAAA
ncbi:MAG TPA: hypothetical protein V6C97_33560 [Oculatellaceae cyanobacterium]